MRAERGGGVALPPLRDRPVCCCFVTGRVPPASSSARRLPPCGRSARPGPAYRPRRGWVPAPAPRRPFAGVGGGADPPCPGLRPCPAPSPAPPGRVEGGDPPLPPFPPLHHGGEVGACPAGVARWCGGEAAGWGWGGHACSPARAGEESPNLLSGADGPINKRAGGFVFVLWVFPFPGERGWQHPSEAAAASKPQARVPGSLPAPALPQSIVLPDGLPPRPGLCCCCCWFEVWFKSPGTLARAA